MMHLRPMLMGVEIEGILDLLSIAILVVDDLAHFDQFFATASGSRCGPSTVASCQSAVIVAGLADVGTAVSVHVIFAATLA
jgi:hypothetical protein